MTVRPMSPSEKQIDEVNTEEESDVANEGNPFSTEQIEVIKAMHKRQRRILFEKYGVGSGKR